MYKAVLFDLDGTLIDSLEDLAEAANYALTRKGYPVHKTEEYKYFVGNGAATLIERILPFEKRTTEEINDLLEIYTTYYNKHSFDKTKPYNGIIDALLELRKLGAKCAVVTNKNENFVKMIIEKFFNEGIFDTVIGYTKENRLKPAPDIVFKALGIMGVEPVNALLVGDTGVDMLTAKNSGCVSVGVTWGFRSKEELEQNHAVYIINNPLELPALFLKHFNLYS